MLRCEVGTSRDLPGAKDQAVSYKCSSVVQLGLLAIGTVGLQVEYDSGAGLQKDAKCPRRA